MQNYVLKRCFRNRQALEEHYKLSLHASRRQKWYKYLEDRDVGNREALKALTVHMPKVTYIYMLHQVIQFYYVLILPATFQKVVLKLLQSTTIFKQKSNHEMSSH